MLFNLRTKTKGKRFIADGFIMLKLMNKRILIQEGFSGSLNAAASRR